MNCTITGTAGRRVPFAVALALMLPLVAAAQVQTLPAPRPTPSAVPALSLPDLMQMTVQQNPRLAQASFAIDAALGRAIQAGLYPNPTLSATGEELGDLQGPGGIITAPYLSQEIVTAGKRKISREAAVREIDQATLSLMSERYARFTAVRQAYFDLLTLQRRISLLRDIVALAQQSVDRTQKLLEAKQAARLDLIQLEVELEKYRAELQAAEREVAATFRRLAASVGVQSLPYAAIVGSLEVPIPDYDLEKAQACVVEVHPDIRSARVGVDRAQLLLRRAQVEPIPNVTVGAGYTRQNQNRSDDWTFGVSVPVPVWNRNQGNIAAAQAQVGEAIQQVGRVENELVERLAEAYRGYASARQRAERYRTAILPRTRESYKLSVEAFKGGQFEYLRVLEAQRAVAQADLEYNRTLGEMWRFASEIAGLLLEDEWPMAPAPCPSPETPPR